MVETAEATTITRMFDPTIWGLRKNQLVIFLLAAAITACCAIIKAIIFPDSLFFTIYGTLIVISAWFFFVGVGLNKERLYHFERRFKFSISRMQGDECIQKYNTKDETKTKLFTRIKNVFDNGFTEFFPNTWDKGMKNNWAVFIELFAYSPEDLEVFFSNAEMFLSSAPDGTIMKTILEARKDNGDSSAPFKRELKKSDLLPILREICYEQVDLCKGSNSKTYKTHMAFIIPYTPKKKEAFQTLENICKSAQKVLKEMGVENKRLDTPEQVYSMFDEMITHNLHIARRSLN